MDHGSQWPGARHGHRHHWHHRHQHGLKMLVSRQETPNTVAVGSQCTRYKQQ
jgi:hypothetical protein